MTTFYRCTVAHTSSALTEPGVGANWMTVWEVVTYAKGDAVTKDGVVYVATQEHTATSDNTPGVGADWQDFWMTLIDVPDLSSAFEVVMNGNEFPIDIGVWALMEVPYDCTIVSATLLANRAGSIQVDIWKTDYTGAPPDVGDSITASSPPAIVGGVKYHDPVLTGWSTALLEGDVLAFNVDSNAVISRCTISLKVERPV